MQYQTNYPYATTAQQYGAGSHPREEQRRRQHEYSQALAQQVAQREQQKRREREGDQAYARHSDGSQNPPQQAIGPSRQEPAERGFFDGLGRNNPQNSRTSFVRGQPQLHHRLPGGPESNDYHPQRNEFPVSYAGHALQVPGANFPPVHQNQPPADNQSFQSGFGFPSEGVGAPPFVSGPGPNVQHGWAPQNAQQNSVSQERRSSQFWLGQGVNEHAAPPGAYGGYASPQQLAQQNLQSGYHQAEAPGPSHIHNAGRRQRTDIHDDGRGDSEEAKKLRLKLQQQQEMQLALERQIEEKRQQKLEDKRRQEEEDRREIMRFEEDQRRQLAEQERLQKEKRRKAELEQQKADQAAAAVAAANQQAKLQQQQKLHAQISQAHPQHPQHGQAFQQQHSQPSPQPQSQQPERFTNVSSPDRSKNPFTNSRAHLFEDSPPPQSPQRGSMLPNNQYGYSNQNASPIRGGPQGFGQTFQHENNGVGRSINSSELRRQYDDMREELRIQKQLVDQLRQAQAQMQHQQQHLSPKRAESGNIPTLMDLEKLRNELRGELAYREQIHRQELASLKREQQQDWPPAFSPHRYSSAKNSLELPVRATSSKIERIPSHPGTGAGYGKALVYRGSAHEQRDSPVNQQQPSIEHLSRVGEPPTDECLMSLRGESKFVYFDGRVGGAGKTAQSGVGQGAKGSEEKQNGDALDEQSESIEVDAPQVRRSTRSSCQSSTQLRSKRQSVVASASTSPSRTSADSEEADTDSDDETHEFVVARITSSPSLKQSQQLSSSPTSRASAGSHRYSQLPRAMVLPSSPSKQSCKWRLESMSTKDVSDSDDELDASLDGEQLEALFQRNVRRHEILLGFQSKVQAQPQDSNQRDDDGGAPNTKMAWAELHQQLESNRRTTIRDRQRRISTASISSNDSDLDQQTETDDEAALVASSRWMPSPLFRTTDQKHTSLNK